jgi:hypothetical protein
MSHDPKQRGTPDRARIDLTQPQEIRYWTRELGITEETLRRAIDALGSNSATRLREFLRTSGMG